MILCAGEKLQQAQNFLSDKCGANHGGWYHLEDENTTYGFQRDGSPMCDNLPGFFVKANRKPSCHEHASGMKICTHQLEAAPDNVVAAEDDHGVPHNDRTSH